MIQWRSLLWSAQKWKSTYSLDWILFYKIHWDQAVVQLSVLTVLDKARGRNPDYNNFCKVNVMGDSFRLTRKHWNHGILFSDVSIDDWVVLFLDLCTVVYMHFVPGFRLTSNPVWRTWPWRMTQRSLCLQLVWWLVEEFPVVSYYIESQGIWGVCARPAQYPVIMSMFYNWFWQFLNPIISEEALLICLYKENIIFLHLYFCYWASLSK